jgi:hypothetical protein
MADTLNCKICNKPTDSIFSVNFEAVPICEQCAFKIAYQQTTDALYRALHEANKDPE